MDEMKKALEKAIKTNADRASGTSVTCDQALKFTQACCNAANALAAITVIST